MSSEESSLSAAHWGFKLKRHLIKAAVFAAFASTAIAAPAQAAVTINLTGSSGTSGSFGNVRTFSGTGGGQTITVTATGWSIHGDQVTSAYLGSYSNGLGVTNRSEGNGDNNRHTIDNSGSTDFVLFQFSDPVDLLSADLRKYGDTDMTFMALSSLPSHAMALSSFLSSISSSSNNLGGSNNRLALEGTSVISNIWAVSARYGAGDTNDAVKLRRISVNAAPAVPEPTTWAMMLLGFFGIGAAMRRKQSQKVALTYA